MPEFLKIHCMYSKTNPVLLVPSIFPEELFAPVAEKGVHITSLMAVTRSCYLYTPSMHTYITYIH
jgi:hypothetical protein